MSTLGQAAPSDGSPDWDDWEPSHEGGWLCFACLVDEVKEKGDLAILLAYETEVAEIESD